MQFNGTLIFTLLYRNATTYGIMIHCEFCWFLEILMILTDSQIIFGDSQTILTDSHDSQMILTDSQWFSLFTILGYSQVRIMRISEKRWESVRITKNHKESLRIAQESLKILLDHWKSWESQKISKESFCSWLWDPWKSSWIFLFVNMYDIWGFMMIRRQYYSINISKFNLLINIVYLK